MHIRVTVSGISTAEVRFADAMLSRTRECHPYRYRGHTLGIGELKLGTRLHDGAVCGLSKFQTIRSTDGDATLDYLAVHRCQKPLGQATGLLAGVYIAAVRANSRAIAARFLHARDNCVAHGR